MMWLILFVALGFMYFLHLMENAPDYPWHD